MKVALVGVGGAGCRVVGQLLEVEAATDRDLAGGRVLGIDAREAGFEAVEGLPPERRLRIGDAGEAAADRDPERGVAAARAAERDIAEAAGGLELPAVDAVLVVAGLAGATGGGAGPVVVETIQSLLDGPVYAVGVLPSDAEGPAASRTALRSLPSVVDRAGTLIGFDNETWGPDDPASPDGYRDANRALATRLVTLFGTGRTDADSVVEGRLDPSDVVRTLETGGVASIGYATTDVPSAAPGGSRSRLGTLLGRGSDHDEADGPDADAIAYLARRSVRGPFTLPCTVSSAERALLVRSGPSRALAGTGFEDGRSWLEREADTVEVLSGAVPHEPASELASLVLLSNVTEVPRIEAMRTLAADE